MRNTSDKTLPFRGRIEGVGPRAVTPEEAEAWLATPPEEAMKMGADTPDGPVPFEELSLSKNFPTGFTGTVKAHSHAKLTSRPRFKFDMDRLVIPASSVFGLRVEDIVVGSQSTMKRPRPAEDFADDVYGAVSGPTCQPDEEIAICMENTTGEDKVVHAALIGVRLH